MKIALLKPLVVYFYILLFGIASSTAMAASNRRHGDSRRELLRIVKMLSSSDIDVATQAVEHISEYHYSDIPDFILSMIEAELKRDKTRIQILIDLYKALEETGTRYTVLSTDKKIGEVTRFVKVKNKILNNYLKINETFRARSPEIKTLLENVTTTLKRNNNPKYNTALFDRIDITDYAQILEESLKYEERKKAREEQAEAKESGTLTTNYQNIRKQLKTKVSKDFATKEIKAGDASSYEIILSATEKFTTDDIAERLEAGELLLVTGREKEVENSVLTLAGDKQRNINLSGPAGSGKTSIVEAIGQKIVLGEFAGNSVTDFLNTSVILETSAGAISALAKTDKPAGQAFAMKSYINAISEVQEDFKRNIILFIDEAHTLPKEHVEAMKVFMDNRSSGFRLIVASTPGEFEAAFKNNPAFKRRLESINVSPLSDEMVIKILKEVYTPYLQSQRPGIVVNDEAYQSILENSRLVFPEKGKMGASQYFLDKITNKMLYSAKSDKIVVTEAAVIDYVQELTEISVDTRDYKAMEKYRNELINKISNDIKGQERMIEDVVDTWLDVLRDDGQRGVRILKIMGRSGTGKTEVVKSFTKHAMGSLDHLLVLEGNQYGKTTNEIALGTFFGAPAGTEFAKASSGIFPEFMDDPSKGKLKSVLLLDEVDKMGLMAIEKLRRHFDEGRSNAGDGKERVAIRQLIVMTSNAYDKEIFPEDITEWTPEKLDEVFKTHNQRRLRNMLDSVLPDSIVNRIDRVTLANIIVRDVAIDIAKMVYSVQSKQFEKKAKINLIFDDSFTEKFLDIYNPMVRGARDLVRSLNYNIKDYVNRYLGTVDFRNNEDVFLKVIKQGDRHFIEISSQSGEFKKEFYDAYEPSSQCKNIF